jgi:hypothetical protein
MLHLQATAKVPGLARPRRGSAARALALIGLGGLLGLAGCATLRGITAGPPQVMLSEREGWLVYTVGALQIEAPATWKASGEPRRIALDAEGAARLEVWQVETRFTDQKACLAAAEEALARGEGALARVRRHPTTLAGRPALVQEADAGGWHGWAYALCDGGVQLRIFFTGRSPIPGAILETWREVVRSARLAGVA